MAEIKDIYNDAERAEQIYPRTHERAVIDNNGTTAETKFQMITDLVNQKQMEIGAVPSDLTPKAGSTNYPTSGGLFNVLYEKNFTRIDLPSQTLVNFNLENSSTWVSSNTYKGVLFPSSGIYALKLVASSYKCDICLLTNDTITAGQTPNYCSGTTKIHVESGNTQYVNIPSDCNYIYVYVSNESVYGSFSVWSNNGTTNFKLINDELLELENDFENSKTLSTLNGWAVGTIHGTNHGILLGYAGRIVTSIKAQIIEYVVADGYSVAFNEYSGEYGDVYDVSGTTWIQGSSWNTGSGTFYPTSSAKTVVVTLSKNPTSSNLSIVSSDGANFSYYHETPIYKLDQKIDDINNRIERKDYFEILHQAGRFPTANTGIGSVLENSTTRDGMDKIFTVDELSKYKYVQMPDGFDVAINQTKVLTKTTDYVNHGWLTIEDGMAIIPTLNTSYQYCVLTFRRNDNETMTTSDTETLNDDVRLVSFPSIPTQDDIVNDVFAYSHRGIFNCYGYRNSYQYLRQPIFELADLHTHGLANSIQSECWIDATNIMIFTTGTTYAIYNIMTDTYISKTKPDTGHCNDVTLVGTTMYVNGSAALNGEEESKLLYSWDMESNTATALDVSAITNGSVGMRVIGGVAKKDENNLYIVCYDYGGNTNQQGEKLVVYNYAISTGTITFLFQLDWVGWFVQGAAYANNGLLYVATNQPPSGSTYTGVAIWCIDVNNGMLLDKLMIDGVFEPQGLQMQVYGFKAYLDFGLTKYNETTKLLRTEVF